jgi:vitamin B12 transporter
MNIIYAYLVQPVKLFFVIVFISSAIVSFGQDSSITKKTHVLPAFTISKKIDKMYSNINTQKIDSSILSNNSSESLSTILAKNSAVTIRSYGATGLSSISLRGGNENHTAILWNGFNLQDPLYGGFNTSLSTVSLIDNISIQHGGGSSAYGSGAVGGTIHLTNTPIFNRKYYGSIQYTGGSFGLHSTALEIGSGGKNFASRIRLFNRSVENNFRFKNETKIGNPTETYTNAQITQKGFLHELYYKLNSNQLISSQFWFQNNYREVPVNITSFNQNNDEFLNEDFYRWALNWNKNGEKINYTARTGLFYGKTNYVNSDIDLNANHNSIRNITEFSATVNILKGQKVTIGGINNYTVGNSDNFIKNEKINSTAFYVAPSLTLLKKIKLNLNLREELIDGKTTPLTSSLNIKYNVYKILFITASASKNNRVPTFNDLYWSGGSAQGNPNLKSEYGFSEDIGLGIKNVTQKSSINSSVSFYQNSINNQIQWIQEGSIWTPKNVKLVNTKGVEFMFNSKTELSKKMKLLLNLTYTYTDAHIKEKSIDESNDVLGKQLIYIPLYQANTTIGLSYNNLSFNGVIQYSGFQYTRADNLDFIPSFITADIGFYYKIKVKKMSFILSSNANNIFNTNYEVRQYYPMPGRNYLIGIKTIIN